MGLSLLKHLFAQLISRADHLMALAALEMRVSRANACIADQACPYIVFYVAQIYDG